MPTLPDWAVQVLQASLTLAAIPPLGGFVSEWLTFEALLQSFRLPWLAARVLCALAAATLALTAGLGLLAFAKAYGFAFLGAAREKHAIAGRLPVRPFSIVALGVLTALLGAVAPWEIHLLGSGLSGSLGLDPSSTAISHPLVLGPVFPKFAVLAPTWLAIVLPAFALVVALLARGLSRTHARRAPVWVTGSGPRLADVQYRPSAYSNPIRVVLRGPLGYRSRLRPADGDGGGLLLDRRVVLAVDRFVYAPLARLSLRASAAVRRLQSGRLSDYLLYVLAVLIGVLVLIPVLR